MVIKLYNSIDKSNGQKALIGYDSKLVPSEGQFKLCIVNQDSLCRFGSENHIVPAKHALCLNDQENVTMTGDIQVIYFSPSFLNSHYTLDYIRKIQWKDTPVCFDNQNFFNLWPFIDRNDYPYGVIPLFPQIFQGIRNNMELINKQIHEQPDWYWSCRARTAFFDILVLMDRLLHFLPCADKSDPIGIIMDTIHAHYNETLSVNELCELSGLSPKHFTYFFAAHNGCGLSEYLTSLRLTLACYDLAYTNDSIADIAFNRGFCSQSRFTEIMRKNKGMTPRQYRTMVTGKHS